MWTFVSLENPWLAGTPDGLVNDPSEDSSHLGLVEIKNPYSVRHMILSEAVQKSTKKTSLQTEKKTRL